ncbi:MAG: lipocalin-like domain-containing protein [Stellaceae bacterium]
MSSNRVTAQRVVAGVLLLAISLVARSSAAEPRTLKDQLAGVWALVAFESIDSAGRKVPSMEGGDLKGRLVLTCDGQLLVQMIAEIPKLASENRLKTTSAEDHAIAHGVLSFFGTYTLSEAEQLIKFRIERSTFPNQATGKDASRAVILAGDELRFENPTRMAGGNVVLAWKRITALSSPGCGR